MKISAAIIAGAIAHLMKKKHDPCCAHGPAMIDPRVYLLKKKLWRPSDNVHHIPSEHQPPGMFGRVVVSQYIMQRGKWTNFISFYSVN